MQISITVEFYHGIKEIAQFLGLHQNSVARLLREGKVPAKRDSRGRWVLCNLDYYASLRHDDRAAGGEET